MRSFRNILFIALSILSVNAKAGDKIKYYFNHTVDNTVSTGTNAINLNGKIDDTLVAYINRSKYTLDIAVYNFTSYSSASLANVVTAINSAYSRGVKIRWIHNGTSATANTGVALINSAIPTLASPSSGPYNIMHDKFMVVDAHSPNPDESIVWTGSTNWSVAQFDQDYDNVIIFQDSALAHAYLGEFNQMWGDTGMTPNATLSKFGPDKVDLGRHNFVIDGKQVELYFSPSDHTNDHIASAILTANKDLYFGMYTFTYSTDANNIVTVKNNGVYVAGILDQYTVTASGSEYPTLNTNLGTNLKVYSGSNLYHNKYLIVDPSDACSDPMVLTGSHNWTSSANTQNDENTVIVHDATIANVYYQSFRADFASLGGTLSTITGCPASVDDIKSDISEVHISPNPAKGNITITYQLNEPQEVSISLINISGQATQILDHEKQAAGIFNRAIEIPAHGLYMIKVITKENVYTYKLVNE